MPVLVKPLALRGDAAFPASVIWPDMPAHARGATVSTFYARLIHYLYDCSCANAKLIGDFVSGAITGEILLTKPSLIMVKPFRAIVAVNINIPGIFMLIPGYRIATAAFAERRELTSRGQILYRLAFHSREGFLGRKKRDFILEKIVSYGRGRHIEFSGKVRGTHPCPIR